MGDLLEGVMRKANKEGALHSLKTSGCGGR